MNDFEKLKQTFAQMDIGFICGNALLNKRKDAFFLEIGSENTGFTITFYFDLCGKYLKRSICKSKE